GFHENGRAASATFKRFAPTARQTELIAQQLEIRHANIARSIHNFRLLMEALGGKDKQLAELVDASNAVFATFAQEDRSFQSTLRLLPGALRKTSSGLDKLATASRVLGPTLQELEPFARSLGPANEATRQLALTTTPIIKNQIRPFAREILPVLNVLGPDTKELSEAFPKLATSFGVLNEFFNELAFNPGHNRAGFGFFLDWGNHTFNSVVSTADAHGVLPRSLIYFNCNILPILKGVASINKTVNLIVALLNPPTKQACQAAGILGASAAAARAQAHQTTTPAGGVFSSLDQTVPGQAPSGPSQAGAAGARG